MQSEIECEASKQATDEDGAAHDLPEKSTQRAVRAHCFFVRLRVAGARCRSSAAASDTHAACNERAVATRLELFVAVAVNCCGIAAWVMAVGAAAAWYKYDEKKAREFSAAELQQWNQDVLKKNPSRPKKTERGSTSDGRELFFRVFLLDVHVAVNELRQNVEQPSKQGSFLNRSSSQQDKQATSTNRKLSVVTTASIHHHHRHRLRVFLESTMARPFENPSTLANNPNGVNYKRFALIAGGIGAVMWYIGERRNARNPADEKITDSTLRPETGTTMQVGTNREQQQHRYPPPSKKTAQGE